MHIVYINQHIYTFVRICVCVCVYICVCVCEYKYIFIFSHGCVYVLVHNSEDDTVHYEILMLEELNKHHFTKFPMT